MWGVTQRLCTLQRKGTQASHLDLDQVMRTHCGNCLPLGVIFEKLACTVLCPAMCHAGKTREGHRVVAWVRTNIKFDQRPKVGWGQALADASLGVLRHQAIVNSATRMARNEDLLASPNCFPAYGYTAALVLHLGQLCQSARRLSDGSSLVQ